jgi:hypothetical protein
MASIKHTHNYSGIFPKLRIAVTFLKFAEIAMAFIQLTLKLSIPRGRLSSTFVFEKSKIRSSTAPN